MRQAWVVGVVAVGSIGCAELPHHQLAAPPPTLSGAQRVAWFDAFAAESERTVTTVTCQKFSCTKSIEKSLTLGNGTRIDHAEDLLPLVRADSISARHMHDARRATVRGHVWRWVALGTALGGLATALVLDHEGVIDDRTALVIGGTGAVFSLFSYFAARDELTVATDAAGRAFESYTKDLADRLQVCVRGMQLVPCEDSTTGSPDDDSPPPVESRAPNGPVAAGPPTTR
jgi:hypothetical protein